MVGQRNQAGVAALDMEAVHQALITDTLVPVPPEEVPGLWDRVEPYIQDANRYGGGKFRAHDWLCKLLAEQALLYVSPNLESAVICELQVYPRSRVFSIILLGGEGGHDWTEYQVMLEQMARHYQCDQMEVFGRPGWRKILKMQGYELAHHVWRKEIDNGRRR